VQNLLTATGNRPFGDQESVRLTQACAIDCGNSTEIVLVEMRASDPPGQYLVVPPDSVCSAEEKSGGQAFAKAREAMQVKLLASESAMRRRRPAGPTTTKRGFTLNSFEKARFPCVPDQRR
jgi:hypothetical protein